MTLGRLGEWLLAILIGAGLVFGMQHLMGPSAEPPPPTRSSVEPATAAPAVAKPKAAPGKVPPKVIEAPEARRIVQQTLDAVGVRPSALQAGSYRLIGPGRSPGDVLPLLSFTCPQSHPCERVFVALEETLTAQGFQFLTPKSGDREQRALHRAVARKGHPILAVRAYPPGPRLSVVVGDVGVEPGLLDRLLKLDEDVTYAVSANSRHSSQVAERLTRVGREVIAHLPLESAGKGLEGQRYLSVDMSPEKIEQETQRLLGQVPGAIGADGHLGGLFSRSRTHMKAVLRVLAQRGHFFLDQRADQASTAGEAARELGVRAVSRTHRIEGEADVEAKLRAVEVALVLEGDAVISISPSPQILDALGPWLEGLRRRKIHIMRLSEVVL